MIRTQPFSMSHNRRSKCQPRFITCHGTIPMPTNWQTKSGIHRRNPACGRRAPPGKRLRRRCWIIPVSPTGTTGSLPRILSTCITQLLWRIKSVSGGRAHMIILIFQFIFQYKKKKWEIFWIQNHIIMTKA